MSCPAELQSSSFSTSAYYQVERGGRVQISQYVQSASTGPIAVYSIPRTGSVDDDSGSSSNRAVRPQESSFNSTAETVSAESQLSHEGKARWVETLLRWAGFPSKHTSKVALGSYLIRLGDRRSVDVYPSGKLVLAFRRDGIDHIQGFKLSDFDRLVKTLTDGSGPGV